MVSQKKGLNTGVFCCSPSFESTQAKNFKEKITVLYIALFAHIKSPFVTRTFGTFFGGGAFAQICLNSVLYDCNLFGISQVYFRFLMPY